MTSTAPNDNSRARPSFGGATPAIYGRSPVADVALSEILAAMSSALDLTEGQQPGHTVRTCIIGMRMAEELDLSSFDRVALYGALLLKDSGCSGNSHRVAEALSGDSPHKPRIALPEPRTVRSRIGSLLRRGSARDDVANLSRGQRGEGIALRLG